MNLIEAYKFCPKCASQLEQKHPNLLVCSSCQFEFWLDSKPTASVIIENEKGEILLVKRAVEPEYGKWDIPGGFMELGESFKQAAKREIKEELGVEIETGPIIAATADNYSYKGILYPTLTIVSKAKIISGESKAEDDVSELKYFPSKEVLRLDLAFDSVRQSLEIYLNR